MFRYFNPIVLAGGKSTRFGSSKACFLNNRIYFLFKTGFVKVFISGFVIGYSFFSDQYNNHGPISAFYTLCFFKFNSFITHYLFFPLDMLFFDAKFFFSIFIINKLFFSYFFFNSTLPFLLSNSYNSLTLLTDLCIFFYSYSMSVNFFLYLLLFSNYEYNYFFKINLFNLNIKYNYFLFIDKG